ncbi:MAG: transposase [Chloroflexi bacterium]|nr:transposase [Chloroflexota bacterium]
MPTNNLVYKPSYRRRLPHIQPPGATLFVTFRLAGSIPVATLRMLAEEHDRIEKLVAKIPDPAERRRREDEEHRRLFGKWDRILDKAETGPAHLKDERIAQLVCKTLHYLDNKKYLLDAFCVMPNHTHLVCTPLAIDEKNHHAISGIMHSIKVHVAIEANRILARDGDFWQHENYDHVVRDEPEYYRIIAYVLNNPVKAGIVERSEDWKWSYSRNANF